MSEPSRLPRARREPHEPLVLDTRSLARRPGTMQRVRSTVPAPADLGLPMLGVPEGSPVDLDLRMESVVEGVLVSGTARVRLAGECARCLDPIEREAEAELQELYAYPDREVGEDEPVLEGDLVDLEPTLRAAVLLELPLSPVCREDCPGLCPQCGVRLADVPPDHRHETADPRWSALAGLKERLTDGRDGAPDHTRDDSNPDDSDPDDSNPDDEES